MHACSIISVNFLAYARTLAESYLKYHPTSKLTVLFLDHPPATIDLSQERFDVIFAEDIGVPNLDVLRMRYTAYELSMALRPWLLLYLLEKEKSEKALFLDADLYFTHPLQDIESLLDRHDLILCPSFLSPIPEDGCFPSDRDILTAGTLNGGFMALRYTPETLQTLSWLKERLILYSYYRPEEGMFGDQKWLDFLPSICEKFLVLRNPAYNVSHWNLHERTITKDSDVYRVNNTPMAFYHFSGFLYDDTAVLSRHQNRLDLRNLPAIRSLVDEYRKTLKKHGHEEMRRIPYGYDRFENGVAVTPVIRRVFEYAGKADSYPHPFRVIGKSFFQWLNEIPRTADPTETLNHLQLSIHTLCPEAHHQFKDPQKKNLKGYAEWLLSTRKRELALDSFFTANLVGMQRENPRSLRHSCAVLLRRRHTFAPYQWLTKRVKSIIGREMFYALKPRPNPTFPAQLRWKRADDVREKGVTIVGSVHAESGIGVGARQHYAALVSAGVPCALFDTRTSPGRQGAFPSSKTKNFTSTIAECGMDELSIVAANEHITSGADGRCIAYATWEVNSLPERYVQILRSFEEIWSPSTFASNVLQHSLQKPVVTIPHAIDVSKKITMRRSDIGIPESCFVFLSVLDLFSHIERKNPLGTIRAFIDAFDTSRNVHLSLAIGHASHFPDDMQRIKDAIRDRPNISIIDGFLDHANILGIMDTCNAYVSLHRSESFGLTIAEAMALRKPVLATDYGGSRDFLDTSTGFVVPYTIVSLPEDIGPYPKGSVWADPDLEAASKYMQNIANNSPENLTRARKAASLMQEKYSLQSVGGIMKQRLETIGAL